MKKLLAALLVSICSLAHSAEPVVVDLEHILNDYYNQASVLENAHLAHGIMKRLVKQNNNEQVVLKWTLYRRTDYLGHETNIWNPTKTEHLEPDYRIKEILDFSEVPTITRYVLENLKTGQIVAKSAATGRIRSYSCGSSCDTLVAPISRSAKFRANELAELLNRIQPNP